MCFCLCVDKLGDCYKYEQLFTIANQERGLRTSDNTGCPWDLQ